MEMKRLKIKTNDPIRYPEDVERIGRILFFEGYWSTPEECQQLWEMYSESVCAGWLILPDDDAKVFDAVRPYIDD